MILSKPSGERIFYTSPKKNCRDYFINAPSNFKDASYLEGILDLFDTSLLLSPIWV